MESQLICITSVLVYLVSSYIIDKISMPKVKTYTIKLNSFWCDVPSSEDVSVEDHPDSTEENFEPRFKDVETNTEPFCEKEILLPCKRLSGSDPFNNLAMLRSVVLHESKNTVAKKIITSTRETIKKKPLYGTASSAPKPLISFSKKTT
jgi:hypothetical protein